jgi:hypothetical protein
MLSLVLVFSLAVPTSLWARPHMVTTRVVDARFESAAAARAAHLAALDRILATPTAAQVAAARGLDVQKLRAGLASLKDDELADIHARAAALEKDPVAGGLGSIFVVLLVVVAVAVILAVLIVEGCKKQGAECLDN